MFEDPAEQEFEERMTAIERHLAERWICHFMVQRIISAGSDSIENKKIVQLSIFDHLASMDSGNDWKNRASRKRRRKARRSSESASSEFPERCEQLAEVDVERLRDLTQEKPRLPALPANLENNVQALADAFGLTLHEVELLRLFVAADQSDAIDKAINLINDGPEQVVRQFLALAVGLEVTDVGEAMKPHATLTAYDLVVFGISRYGYRNRAEISDTCKGIINIPHLSSADLLDHIAPAPQNIVLTLDDFAHMRDSIERGVRVLRHGLETGQRGCNLWLVGTPGTGKTSAAHLMAKLAGAKIRHVGLGRKESDPPSVKERVGSFAWANKILTTNNETILLFDEAEHAFNAKDREGEPIIGKEWWNRQIDQSPVPAIFCSNAAIDPAYARRWEYPIEFKIPTRAQRKVIWKQLTDGRENLSEGYIDELADRFEAAPAIIGKAVDVSRNISGDGLAAVRDVEAILEEHVRLQKGQIKPRIRRAWQGTFDKALVNCDEDLSEIEDAVQRFQVGEGPGLPMLFYGPPRTGKSEFGRHLGQLIGRETIVIRPHDIFDKYVGESEKRIAGLFESLEREGVIAVIEECDSYLRDRTKASYSWEYHLADEMLLQLEQTSAIVILSSNLVDELDPAVFGRMVIKAKFDFLKPTQHLRCFEHLRAQIGTAPKDPICSSVKRGLLAFSNLAVGDFALIARRGRAMRRTYSDQDLLDLIHGEAGLKTPSSHPIGFAGTGGLENRDISGPIRRIAAEDR